MNAWHIPIAQDENSQWHVDWHGIPEGLCLGGNGRRFFSASQKKARVVLVTKQAEKKNNPCLFPGL